MFYWTIIVGILAALLYRLAYPLHPVPSSEQLIVESKKTIHEKESMAAAPILKYLTVPAVAKHTATVIFVHGLGDTGNGWRPVADMFKVDPALAHVKWMLPHSPVRPVTANMGITMPSWFDIYSFGFDTTEDEQGMVKSANMINELVKYEIEINGIDPSRIVLGGFSQGGAMSLLSGLTGDHKLAGIAVMSGWLPMKNKFKEMASKNAASTPVFWGTGSADPLVKLQFAKMSSEFLVEQLGIPVAKDGELKGLDYNVYDGLGHETTPQELEDLKKFIKMAIPK
ncbi:hypothetical protein GALMADRAFT_236716 [Galerina marginata CBS 339.88]|uniref:Acyl-protein thioesterase 1 n=1 Tax=Galerina marginata (strain CBS 339.88) TaxID=685588 RepID=A0A067TP24_GALM3|nr:hypothetical protein GALMADRAFT_236716 [Galerina marginata CBS 339.88]